MRHRRCDGLLSHASAVLVLMSEGAIGLALPVACLTTAGASKSLPLIRTLAGDTCRGASAASSPTAGSWRSA